MSGKKQESQKSQPQDNHFPIVGIGASAGGLEALELFLKNVPPSCGLAFVIVSHLSPTHKDMMAELLQRHTTMPVTQIEDRIRIEPDHVYVIPPNRDLSLLHGVLHLHEPVASGLRLPIDHFFRSLADDRQERGIGVILSGMGSDGTLGLRALKEKSGAVFVQAPTSAKFAGMPRSAIDAGLADIVAPAEELAGRIITYLQHVPHPATPATPGHLEKNQSGLEKIILLLRTKTGHDFSLYKKNTLYRRIERRMGLHQLDKIANYASYLRSNPLEIDLLFKELLIGVTSFFRDPAMWEQLKVKVIPALLTSRAENATLRAWVTACSTGEEAYSLAMVFREALEELTPGRHLRLQIFATDIDKDAIDKARSGFFPPNIATDVSEERLHRFFIREEYGYRVSQEIREMVIFAPQNLVTDPPFTKLDLLTCRNLLIYLEPSLQKKLLSLFHYSLNSDGVLVLGMSETVGQSSELFVPLPGKMRLNRRADTAMGTNLTVLSPTVTHPQRNGDGYHAPPQPLPNVPNLSALTDELLLRHYTPAAVLTTPRGDIVYLSAKTGKYLEPTVGKANLNIFAMAREGLAGPLHEAFARAVREKVTVTLKDLKIQTNGSALSVDVVVQPLSAPAEMQGMMLIVFREIGEASVKKTKAPSKTKRNATDEARLAELTRELQQSREEVYSTREEMQASQEELKATNEELQSTNEELQSTNEELTTSKEEMQSMNEELQTINQELTSKVDELTHIGDDMENLLNSTDIATLFLDSELRVRRFTPKMTKIIKLIPGDVGRPFTDQVNELDYPDFADDVQQVLRALVSSHRQISTRDGRWFLVRIMPYRTRDNRIDGAVITFVDISDSKTLETVVTEALSVLQTRFDDQSFELKAAKDLENVLGKAHALLAKRFEGQTIELCQARADLKGGAR
ncbi:MAG: chemotaxis protein CheB [Desulfobulbaceae bacterium BRH_c16a]|nr:MAG: chemotaxis protein CheB [Desulfobulbaceae bacterium BRH_c16a]